MEALITEIVINGRRVKVDLSQALDISIPFQENGLQAYHSAPLRFQTVVMGNFVGDVSKGGSVNFRDIQFNPHSNGTHTECVGHIHPDWLKVNHLELPFFMQARVVSVLPENNPSGDSVLSLALLEEAFNFKPSDLEALIIRTLPNSDAKKTLNYSATNPPYFTDEALRYLANKNIKHLLIDLPSVDREEDEGKLVGHKIWWDFEGKTRYDCTITELVFVPNAVLDGNYLLHLEVANFSSDASPSKPLLFEVLG